MMDWIVYYERMDVPKGLDALMATVCNAGSIEHAKRKVQSRGPNYVLAAEPRDQGLEAKRKFGADPRMPKDKGLFIEQRVSWLRSMAETQPAKRVLKPKTCDGCGATDGQYHGLHCATVHPLSDEAEAASRSNLKKAMEGDWVTQRLNVEDPNSWMPRSEDIYDIKPTGTPFMDLARQAMKGEAYAKKQQALEAVRTYPGDFAGMRLNVDPKMPPDTFKVGIDPGDGNGDRIVITQGRRAGKTAMIESIMAMGPDLRAGKSAQEAMVEAMKRLWAEPVATVHDEVQYADPSAERDALAAARMGGFSKPENKPHKQEKPANPYPPPHPKAEPPAGLLAVSDMSARMGNRWAP